MTGCTALLDLWQDRRLCLVRHCHLWVVGTGRVAYEGYASSVEISSATLLFADRSDFRGINLSRRDFSEHGGKPGHQRGSRAFRGCVRVVPSRRQCRDAVQRALDRSHWRDRLGSCLHLDKNPLAAHQPSFRMEFLLGRTGRRRRLRLPIARRVSIYLFRADIGDWWCLQARGVDLHHGVRTHLRIGVGGLAHHRLWTPSRLRLQLA